MSGLELRPLEGFSLDALLRVDRGLRVRYASPEVARILKSAPGPVPGCTLVELGLPEALCAAVARALDTGEEGAHGWQGAGPGGEREVHLRLVPERDADGALDTVLVIARDVTGSGRGEETPAGSREYHWGLLERFPVLVWQADASGFFDLFNRSWLDFTGRTLHEEQGDGWMVGIHPDDLARCTGAFHSAFHARGSLEMEFRLRHHAGEYRVVHLIGHPLVEPDGRLLGHIGCCVDITQRANAEQALLTSERDLRALNVRLQETREAERVRISREIHDELGQMLTGLRFEVSRLKHELVSGRGDAIARVNGVESSIDMTISSLQRFVAELRPRVLDDFGLVAAAEWLLRDFSAGGGIGVEFELSRQPFRLPPSYETNVYRILQEALTNVRRHSRAEWVRVVLEVGPDRCVMEVADDGVGVDSSDNPVRSGVGVIGMKERAQEMGGSLMVTSAVGAGTRVRLEVPLTAGLPAEQP